jgi:hypothetical protein
MHKIVIVIPFRSGKRFPVPGQFTQGRKRLLLDKLFLAFREWLDTVLAHFRSKIDLVIGHENSPDTN